jgi:hypothetical protein
LKTCWRVEPPLLTAALDGSERSNSHTGGFTPGERASGTHWIRGWVGPRADLGAVEKRKIFSCRESNPGHPARSPSLYRLTYPNSLFNLFKSNLFFPVNPLFRLSASYPFSWFMIEGKFKDSVDCHPHQLSNAVFYNKLYYRENRGSHGGDYEDYYLLGRDTVKFGRQILVSRKMEAAL